MMDEIESMAEQLAFMNNPAAAYRAALYLQGAENPEAAIIRLRGAWDRREAALRRELETGQRKTLTKKDIMKIKDPVRRQQAIRENINLFT